jgi:hypothetical protein
MCLTVTAEGLEVDSLHVRPNELEAEQHKGRGPNHRLHPGPRPRAHLRGGQLRKISPSGQGKKE